MGDMASFDLEEVLVFEDLRDKYANANMSGQDAFEAGFLGSGGEVLGFLGDNLEDRINILSDKSVLDNLDHLVDHLEVGAQGVAVEASVESPWLKAMRDKHRALNDSAIFNLLKECPTCNCCNSDMIARSGKFGDFFYCKNKCEEQKTVSKKYWDSVRVTFDEDGNQK